MNLFKKLLLLSALALVAGTMQASKAPAQQNAMAIDGDEWGDSDPENDPTKWIVDADGNRIDKPDAKQSAPSTVAVSGGASLVYEPVIAKQSARVEVIPLTDPKELNKIVQAAKKKGAAAVAFIKLPTCQQCRECAETCLNETLASCCNCCLKTAECTATCCDKTTECTQACCSTIAAVGGACCAATQACMAKHWAKRGQYAQTCSETTRQCGSACSSFWKSAGSWSLWGLKKLYSGASTVGSGLWNFFSCKSTPAQTAGFAVAAVIIYTCDIHFAPLILKNLITLQYGFGEGLKNAGFLAVIGCCNYRVLEKGGAFDEAEETAKPKKQQHTDDKHSQTPGKKEDK